MREHEHGEHVRHTVTVGVTDELAILLDKLADKTGIEHVLKSIERSLHKIMATQAEVDAKVAAANEKLDALGTAIQAEADQVAAALAALPPSVDISGFDGVVDRLGAAADGVSNIFTPVEPAP